MDGNLERIAKIAQVGGPAPGLAPTEISTDRTVQRRIAGEAFARLPELFALSHADTSHQASIGFSYLASRLFQLVALPGGLPRHWTPRTSRLSAKPPQQSLS